MSLFNRVKCKRCNDNGLVQGPNFDDGSFGCIKCPDCTDPMQFIRDREIEGIRCHGEGEIRFRHDFLDPQTEDWAKCPGCPDCEPDEYDDTGT